MKKILGILTTIIILTGCSISLSDMDNTPTKQAEKFLNNYQTLNEEVLDDLDLVIEKETTFTNEQKEKYRDIMKKHYKDLNYSIKEETVNGDSATVEVEIEVTDFYKALNGNDDIKTEKDFYDDEGNYDQNAYNEYRLDRLKNADEKVKYTLYLKLTKDDSSDWELEDLDNDQEQKILGMYEH